MKTFSSSQLSKTPAKVLAAAREDGAIIQIKRTNGEVMEEFVLTPRLYSFGESSTETDGEFFKR